MIKVSQILYQNQDLFWEKGRNSPCKREVQETFVIPHLLCLVRDRGSKQDREGNEASWVPQ